MTNIAFLTDRPNAIEIIIIKEIIMNPVSFSFCAVSYSSSAATLN